MATHVISSKEDSIEVRYKDQTFVIGPGDTLDLGAAGIILYHGGRRAAAERLIAADRHESTNKTIAHVEQRVRQEVLAEAGKMNG